MSAPTSRTNATCSCPPCAPRQAGPPCDSKRPSLEGGDLQAGLEAWLPLDEERLTDWRVIIAFWGVAVSDPELAEVQNGHVTRARARVEKLLRQDRQLPEKSSDLVRLAQQVVALTLGIALQAVFESGGPNARAQRALLADGLFRLLPAAV